MNNRIVPVFLLFLLAIGGVLSFADAPTARLVYADDLTQIEILDFTGEPVERVDFGSRLLIGFAVRTGDTSAELQLEPNGSILRIDEHSFFKFEELQGLENTEVNGGVLIDGAMRVVAATRRGQRYRISTSTVVLGVRGTDFIVSIDGSGATSVGVAEGSVQAFEPFSRTEERIGAGQGLVAEEKSLSGVAAVPEIVGEAVSDAAFVAADVDTVKSSRDPDYSVDFDYFSTIEYESFRQFFADDDFFDDYQEYMDRFYDYYESEMADFREVLQKERQEINRRRDEARDAISDEERAFQEWLESQR